MEGSAVVNPIKTSSRRCILNRSLVSRSPFQGVGAGGSLLPSRRERVLQLKVYCYRPNPVRRTRPEFIIWFLEYFLDYRGLPYTENFNISRPPRASRLAEMTFLRLLIYSGNALRPRIGRACGDFCINSHFLQWREIGSRSRFFSFWILLRQYCLLLVFYFIRSPSSFL